jgi:aryl-alcohol dehydrogenase-like predicted oxidoreductase
METTTLGRTGIEVSRICMGCWQAAGWATSDDDRFVRTIQHGLDQGLTFLDTAVAYGRGHSEELVAKAVAGRRAQVVIATKLSYLSSRPADVRKALDAALARLKTDYVDVFQQHWPPKDIPLADTVGALEKLKEEGKIRAVGVSNWMEPEWAEIDNPSRVDSLQPNHSLLWRSIERSVLPMCIERRIAVITYSSLCQGILAGKFTSLDAIPKDPRASNRLLKPGVWPQVQGVLGVLAEVAGRYGKTMSQTAIRWLLDQPGITAAIVGASRPEQVDQNLGALGWKLEPADWQRLAEASWPLSKDLQPHDSLWNWHPRTL